MKKVKKKSIRISLIMTLMFLFIATVNAFALSSDAGYPPPMRKSVQKVRCLSSDPGYPPPMSISSMEN